MANIRSLLFNNSTKLNIKSVKAKSYQEIKSNFDNYEEIDYSDLNNDGKLDNKDVDVLSKATGPNFAGLLPQYFDFNNTMHDKDMYLSSYIAYVYEAYDEFVYTIEGNKSNQLKKWQYPLNFSWTGISIEQRINGYYRPNY